MLRFFHGAKKMLTIWNILPFFLWCQKFFKVVVDKARQYNYIQLGMVIIVEIPRVLCPLEPEEMAVLQSVFCNDPFDDLDGEWER